MANGEFTFTDKQWYNFICGFYAGLKLKDLTAPGYVNSTVLQPIGIGGTGKIGIEIGKTYMQSGYTTYDIPVYTHDVDVGYSGFTCSITLLDTRINFVSCLSGEFGTVTPASGTGDVRYQWNSTSRILYVRALKDSSVKEITEPIILFYIRVRISGTVYESEKLTLFLNSASYTDMNSTTLLKYVLVDGKPALYYITPLSNVDGYIYGSEKYGQSGVLTPISKPEGIGMTASPSGVGVGSSYTPPGNRGVVPIYANSNADEGFAYDKVHVKIKVDDDVLFKYISVVGNGWGLSVKQSKDTDGRLILDITATRDKAAVDSCTFAYIDYEIDSSGTEYKIKLIASDGQLGHGTIWKDVPSYDGTIYFPIPPYTGGGGGGGLGAWGGGGSGGGGCGGSGSLWSSSGGVMWVKADSAPPYPIYLKPGWNDVWWWIPWLFPDSRFEDVTIEIVAPGYILIPAGFEWWMSEPEGAPVGPAVSKQVEGLKFKDMYDIDVKSSPGPTNIDGNIDDIDFTDVYKSEIIEIANKYIDENIDDIDFTDVYMVDGTGTASDIDDNVEDYGMIDVFSTSVLTSKTDDVAYIEDTLSVGDVSDTSKITEKYVESEHVDDYNIDTLTNRELEGADVVDYVDIDIHNEED